MSWVSEPAAAAGRRALSPKRTREGQCPRALRVLQHWLANEFPFRTPYDSNAEAPRQCSAGTMPGVPRNLTPRYGLIWFICDIEPLVGILRAGTTCGAASTSAASTNSAAVVA